MKAPAGWDWLAKRLPRRRPDRDDAGILVVQIDGAIGATGVATGLGVVVRGADASVRSVHKRRLGPMTNNEAEYAALILALEVVLPLRPAAVRIVSDSEIVVYQMQGRFSVNSPALKALHRQACALARRIPDIRFTHVPRDKNALADALAREALWPDTPWRFGDGGADVSPSMSDGQSVEPGAGTMTPANRAAAPRSLPHVRGRKLRRRR